MQLARLLLLLHMLMLARRMSSVKPALLLSGPLALVLVPQVQMVLLLLVKG